VPTFNRGPYLERCLRSILDQTYRRLECLVIDGGSTDGSVALLERLAAADSRLRFISEPDQGEVDATNKGLDLARGDIIGIQASDDYYVADAVEKSVEFLLAHPEHIGVGADELFVDPSGKSLGRGAITYRGRLSPERIKRILVLRYLVSPVIHGTFFGWRQRLARHGKINPEAPCARTSISTSACSPAATPSAACHGCKPFTPSIPTWARSSITTECGSNWTGFTPGMASAGTIIASASPSAAPSPTWVTLCAARSCLASPASWVSFGPCA